MILLIVLLNLILKHIIVIKRNYIITRPYLLLVIFNLNIII